MKIIALFLVLVIWGQLYGSTTPESKAVSQEIFDRLSEEVDLSKTENRLVPRQFEMEKTDPVANQPNLFGSGRLLKALAYLAIIVLVFWIIYSVFGNIKVEEKIDLKKVDLVEVEDLEEIDVGLGLREALARGDYRMAIRMRFIEVLQSLSTEELINWRPEKTNRDYLREIRSQHFYVGFKELAHIYEWVWYGNTDVGREQYIKIAPKFDTFNVQPR